MQNIFRGACQVLIWLGEAYEDAYFTFETANRHNKRIQEYIGPAASEPNIGEQFTCDQQWLMFIQFYERAWLIRLWVIQEVTLARRVSVICGQLVVGWQHLSYASYSIMCNLGRKVILTSLARSSLTNIYYIAMLSSRKIGAQVGYGERQESLATLVSRHRVCHATDPRDRIFALLGVSTSVLAVAFPVDYTKSTAAIYTDFALYTMREDANMDIPSACCPPSTSTSCLTFPSWVPDWTKNHHKSWWKIGSVDRYNAASDVACSFCLGKDPNMLLVDGLLMSQVAHVCPPWNNYFLRIFH